MKKFKYGIFSDIHSNLEALHAVLTDMHEQGVTHPICLGDIVGYNANPRECLQVVREMSCPTIRGNHDEIVGKKSRGRKFQCPCG
jgi:predicted phosphodiesterase